MFDQIKGMAAMASLLKDLPRIQQRIAALRQELGEARLTGESGGGAVRATADGLMRITSVEVDPALLARLVDPADPGDHARAQELIAGAVNAALASARERVDFELAEAGAELGLPIPPGALGGLLSL
jgi:nucleoid-associated protein EbfC